MSNGTHSIAALIQRLQSELQQRGRPGDFSPQGVDELLDRQMDFLEELARESIRQARRADADFVSAADVERADLTVRGPNSARRLIWAEAVGGLLAGAGLGEFVGVLADDDPGALAIALPSVLMLIGAVLMTAALLRR